MKKLLKKYFGYDEFRPLQEEIVNNVLLGKDTFVLMPTGGGKSLCYQLPALKFNGITLVISPLIALMKDQVDALKENGIKAEFINSSLDAKQIDAIRDEAKNKNIKILYIAPERLALKEFQEFLKELKISLIAIDEAHCISEWGHDFRPDYRNLKMLKKMYAGVPIIALTATATEKVREDIVDQLGLQKAPIFMSSFNRENLRISVIEKKQAFQKLVPLLKKYKDQSVIIYCHSRKDTERLVENLKLNGFKALAYHAGLDVKKRKIAQEYFIKDKVDIIVATIAFGMGIDKPDVRLVVHYTFPKSIEGYYQEIGRAGRDGLESECVTFYTFADARKHEFFINQISDSQQRDLAQRKLSDVLDYCDLTTCRKKYLLGYFGEKMEKDNCGSCDSCLEKKEYFDATTITQKIMSAILKTENRFGKNHIIDILLGKKNQKVLINRHDKLSVFDIVKDYTENELAQIINQLVNQGYLNKTDGKYPILSVAKKGLSFLVKKEKLELAKPQAEAEISGKKKLGNLDYNTELFEILRSLRKEIAEKENVPPFVVFGDVSLREMAYYIPTNKENFSKISGVGSKKLEKYSKAFLKEISKFVEENKLKNINILDSKITEPEIKTSEARQIFYNQTFELLQKKVPIERIAKHEKIKIDTVINHIEKIIDSGKQIDLEYLKLPHDRFKIISNAFNECGDEKLKPVFEYLKGKYSYDEIKLVRLLLRA